jgi:hypothetical protein
MDGGTKAWFDTSRRSEVTKHITSVWMNEESVE